MSAMAFATSAAEWNPFAARRVYGESILDDLISVSVDNDVAWFVIETVD